MGGEGGEGGESFSWSGGRPPNLSSLIRIPAEGRIFLGTFSFAFDVLLTKTHSFNLVMDRNILPGDVVGQKMRLTKSKVRQFGQPSHLGS